MKQFFYVLITVLAGVFMTSCKNDKVDTTVTTGQDSVQLENTIPEVKSTGGGINVSELSGTYTIDPTTSLVSWEGSSASKKHTGIVKFKNGSFTMDKGNITGGSFELDMPTLVNTDLKPEDGKEKLESHLKAADFFDVGKYPTAKFVVTSAQTVNADNGSYKINGDLTVKDKTNPIIVDLGIVGSENGIKASTPAFNVDRTKYGITYNSGIINTAKDKLIDDNLKLVINIDAKK